MKARIYFFVLIVVFFLSCTDNSTSPEAEGLKKPANLELQQIDNSNILLTWEDRSEDETGFRIDRKVDIAAWENDFQILGEGATGYIDTNLTVFGEYQYRVSAFNDLEETESIIASLLFRDLDSLAAPTDLVLEQLNAYSIQLWWQDNSSSEEGFRIDRKIGDYDWEENYQILDANTTTFLDGDLIAIADYIYRVSAFIGNELSDPAEASHYFFYEDLYTIEPIFTGQINITPSEPFEMVLGLYDVNGELVERNFEVWFKYLDCPEGMSINNQVFGVGDSLSVISENGIVSVILYAGSQSGPAALEISAHNMLNEWFSTIKSNIIVHSSPPENMEIAIGGVDSGVNMGGGIWQIEVSAIISDEFGNPADYGTAVWFSLEDPQNPGSEPEWATINAAAYVGNENANGDSLAGVAFTTLNYEGAHTNDSLIVWVEVNGAVSLIESTMISMPIQFANIDIIATPSHVDWIGTNNNQDILYTTLIVFVTDGQNNPIDLQSIYIDSSHGFPVPGIIAPDDPYLGYTYENPEWGNGFLRKEFGFYKYECSPPVPVSPGTTYVTIEALILGTNVSGQTMVTLNRYID